MKELILIKTNESQKVKTLLEREHIIYETYQEEKLKKTSEAELEQAYREAWSNPRRYQEAQLWENAAMSDWAERARKDKK